MKRYISGQLHTANIITAFPALRCQVTQYSGNIQEMFRKYPCSWATLVYPPYIFHFLPEYVIHMIEISDKPLDRKCPTHDTQTGILKFKLGVNDWVWSVGGLHSVCLTLCPIHDDFDVPSFDISNYIYDTCVSYAWSHIIDDRKFALSAWPLWNHLRPLTLFCGGLNDGRVPFYFQSDKIHW